MTDSFRQGVPALKGKMSMLYAILTLTLALPGAVVAILTLVDRYQKRPPKENGR